MNAFTRNCRPLVLLTTLLVACDRGPDPQTQAQAVVDEAIRAHGGELYQRATVVFDFRDKHYRLRRNNAQFSYERTFHDSTGQVRDVLDNETFFREINGRKATLTEKQTRSFRASLNSVAYFALLPYGLNDAAVRKRYLGVTTLEGEPYRKVQITFGAEGGGTDYTDTFVYWIHRRRYTVDYLAYTNEGLRFRQAVNSRVVNGIRFSDYVNYESPTHPKAPVTALDSLFTAGKLRKLSDIVTENIRVNYP
ncbi:MAG: hypothetical protein H7Z75_01450 [Ferruginibacter sp.]|nr:hypothetical protein [Cytophagales bacterium]